MSSVLAAMSVLVALPGSSASAIADVQSISAANSDQSKPPGGKHNKRSKKPSRPPRKNQSLNTPPPAVPRGGGDNMPVASLRSDSTMAATAAGKIPEVGEKIGGLAGAIWADRNNDGVVDGYVFNGQYYAGAPDGYDATRHGVALGSRGGAAMGSAAGAVIPGASVLQGAVVGAAVSGLAGAVWADRDNDGVVDGYIYNGQYYSGAPSGTLPAPVISPSNRPERGR